MQDTIFGWRRAILASQVHVSDVDRFAMPTTIRVYPSVSKKSVSRGLKPRAILPRFVLFLLMAGGLPAADSSSPSLALQVSTETAPAGGWAQFKISAVNPVLVGNGSISMDFDPTVFGNITQVAVFGAMGDAMGYAHVKGQHVDAHFSSTSAAIAQLPGLPVLVVGIQVLNGVATGTTTAVNFDPTGSAWLDNLGNTYTVTASPATFTVGGSFSIAGVTPGGGLLPKGTLVRIAGAGFDADTAVNIDGVAISAPVLVSPQELDVTLAGATDLTGRDFHLTKPGLPPVDYFSALPGAPGTAPTGFTTLTGTQVFLPAPTYSVLAVGNYHQDGDPGQENVALLNQSLQPVNVAALATDGDDVLFEDSFTIPAGTLYLFSADQMGSYNWGSQELSTPWIVSSAPIRMLEYVVETPFPPQTPPQYGELYPPAPTEALPALTFNLGSVPWNWQIGNSQSAAATINIPGNLGFIVSTSGDSWFGVTPLQGTAPATLTVTPNFGKLNPGPYSGTITVTPVLPAALAGVATAKPAVITVTVNVTSSAPTVGTNTNGLGFSAQYGQGAPAAQTLPITSSGPPEPFSVTVTPVTGGNWLSVTPSGGTTPSTIALNANPSGLAPGNYSATLTIQGPNNSVSLFVDLQVWVLTAAPPTLTYYLTTGAPQTDRTFVGTTGPPNNAVISSVSEQTQSGGDWLIVNPIMYGASVAVSAVGLSPGNYQGTVTMNSANYGSVSLAVTLVVFPVLATPPMVTPFSVILTAPAGQMATENITVGPQGGGPMLCRATAFDPPNASSGEYLTPVTAPVSASAALPGISYENLAIICSGGTVNVPVTLYASATAANPPAVAAITSAASLTSGAVSPGELISVFGAGVGAAPAPLTLNAGGKVATTLGGTQLLVNGVPAPLTYTSAGQVNAVVPYEAGASGTAGIQVLWNGLPAAEWDVPLAAAAPGIFTLNGTGLGPGAVINQDGSVNGPANPAARGTVIQIYATGEGLTMPAGVTGSVTNGTVTPLLPVTVQIGGVDAHVMFAGSAPGDVAGVLQINAVVPPSVAAGSALPLFISVGGVRSPAGVTMAVE